MKKALLPLLVLALTACDKPTASVELECRLHHDWQNPSSLSYADEDYKDLVPVLVNVKTYQNNAVLVVNGKESSFYKSKEEKSMGEFGRVHIDYTGVFPDTNRMAKFSVYGDIASRTILQFDLQFDNVRHIRAGQSYFVNYSCVPTKEEYTGDNWSARVPWNHDYKLPSKIEKCINTIVDKVYCDNAHCDSLYIFHNGRHNLTAEAAMAISPNWDYSDMRLYTNDGKLDEHEKDACEVVDRLFKYVDEAGLNDLQVIQDAMRDCGKECESVLTTGDLGDFLIRLPESEALLKIANKTKNAKFMSGFNLNTYAKAGYCLLNIIPYNTMEKLGVPDNPCHYRLYCGAPGLMDYDQFYAVEVCN